MHQDWRSEANFGIPWRTDFGSLFYDSAAGASTLDTPPNADYQLDTISGWIIRDSGIRAGVSASPATLA